jgi:hypothetical protein
MSDPSKPDEPPAGKPPVQYIRPQGIVPLDQQETQVITRVIKEPSFTQNLYLEARNSFTSGIKSLRANLRADTAFCREALAATLTESRWGRMIATVTHVHKLLNWLLGLGVPAGIIALYVAYIYPLAGPVGSIIIVLSLLVSASLVMIRVTRKLYDKISNALGDAREQVARSNTELESVKGELSVLREELTKAESRYAELTKYKIVPQIDEAATRIYLHTESPTVVRITAHISLRFENKDIYAWTMKGLDVELHKVGQPKAIWTWVHLRYMSEGLSVPKEKVEGMVVPAGQMTKPYIAIALLSLDEDEIKQASDLDLATYLNLVMNASNQPPFNVKIFVSWEQALKEGGARPLYVINAETINKLTDHRLG